MINKTNLTSVEKVCINLANAGLRLVHLVSAYAVGYAIGLQIF